MGASFRQSGFSAPAASRKIKLEAKDPDDGKLRFLLVSKPSHGRIVQFSISTGTLTYIPDENYNGQDDFSFKVYDTV